MELLGYSWGVTWSPGCYQNFSWRNYNNSFSIAGVTPVWPQPQPQPQPDNNYPPPWQDDDGYNLFDLSPWEKRLAQAQADLLALQTQNALIRAEIETLPALIANFLITVATLQNAADSLSQQIDQTAKWLGTDRVIELIEIAIKVDIYDNLVTDTTQIAIAFTNALGAGLGIDFNNLTIAGADSVLAAITSLLPVHDETWLSSNRIYQSSANLLLAIQQISGSQRTGLQTVGSMLAQWGNALKKYGVVGKLAYLWQNYTPDFGSNGINKDSSSGG
jgi:hypothetical protein